MKKLLIYLIFLPLFLFPTIAFASDFSITGENVILYNLNDDTILYEKNSDTKTNIASLTKMMSALVAIENISSYDDTVTITAADFNGTDGYSKAGFSIGDVVTYRDLLYGVLLPSGAEAVNALVRNTLKDDFIAAMNAKAEEIGLKNTSFSNAIGKDAIDNYSTASDVAKLLEYAIKNPLFKEIFTTKEYVTSNGITLNSTLYPYKDILDINKIAGSKSGFTKGAGRCLASITSLNGVDYLLVVINSSTAQNYSAVKDTITIYDYYNENYSYQTVLNEGKIITSIPVKWGNIKTYDITSPKDVELFIKNDTADKINITYDGVEEIAKNTKKGSHLGTLIISLEDEVLYTLEISLDKDIIYYNIVVLIIIALVILIILFILLKKIRRHRKRRRKRR